jgi:hypothetical protein
MARSQELVQESAMTWSNENSREEIYIKTKEHDAKGN